MIKNIAVDLNINSALFVNAVRGNKVTSKNTKPKTGYKNSGSDINRNI